VRADRFQKPWLDMGYDAIMSYHIYLPSSATVKMDNEENMENARYATNGGTPL
jgi:hypothetical protein